MSKNRLGSLYSDFMSWGPGLFGLVWLPFKTVGTSEKQPEVAAKLSASSIAVLGSPRHCCVSQGSAVATCPASAQELLCLSYGTAQSSVPADTAASPQGL